MGTQDDAGDESMRWYDADPALRRAMAQLRRAEDQYQAQIALNIIKIIVEHQSESDGGGLTTDGLDAEALRLRSLEEPPAARARRRRWYDVNETLRSAMLLLKECPTEVQRTLFPTIVRMIEETLASTPDP